MAEMDVQLASARGAVTLGHVLLDDVRRLRAGNENRPDVADERLHDVALRVIERIRRRDRLPFLAKGAVEPSDDLRLAEERDEPFFQCPGEAQEVVDLEKLLG